ncbi:hypothetical protein T265_06580 [Opisthorchis viverrini]|uniref:Uncharacterized protein n=1 Tax=Opisthorchis viverrini TaxID=6198 RepID=A0A074ZRX6_OPIVI|nr:hypothetical protein T265_06580 [Opisthorchis viverrini]KER26100.1 hypothetical protein T265_06580 [Opisthorchis viverrini]
MPSSKVTWASANGDTGQRSNQWNHPTEQLIATKGHPSRAARCDKDHNQLEPVKNCRAGFPLGWLHRSTKPEQSQGRDLGRLAEESQCSSRSTCDQEIHSKAARGPYVVTAPRIRQPMHQNDTLMIITPIRFAWIAWIKDYGGERVHVTKIEIAPNLIPTRNWKTTDGVEWKQSDMIHVIQIVECA